MDLNHLLNYILTLILVLFIDFTLLRKVVQIIYCEKYL